MKNLTSEFIRKQLVCSLTEGSIAAQISLGKVSQQNNFPVNILSGRSNKGKVKS